MQKCLCIQIQNCFVQSHISKSPDFNLCLHYWFSIDPQMFFDLWILLHCNGFTFMSKGRLSIPMLITLILSNFCSPSADLPDQAIQLMSCLLEEQHIRGFETQHHPQRQLRNTMPLISFFTQTIWELSALQSFQLTFPQPANYRMTHCNFMSMSRDYHQVWCVCVNFI